MSVMCIVIPRQTGLVLITLLFVNPSHSVCLNLCIVLCIRISHYIIIYYLLNNILIQFIITKKTNWSSHLDGTHNTLRIWNNLPSSLPIKNSLKLGDALSPLSLNFTLEYAIRKVQETNLGLDMNGTHQVLA